MAHQYHSAPADVMAIGAGVVTLATLGTMQLVCNTTQQYFKTPTNIFLVGENSIAETNSIFGAGLSDTETRLGNALKHKYSTAVLPDCGQSTPKLLNQSLHR